MASLPRRSTIPKSGTIRTLPTKGGQSKTLARKKSQWEGMPESLTESFEELMRLAGNLSMDCLAFAERDVSESFSELEASAIALAQSKSDVEASILTFFQEYMKLRVQSKRNFIKEESQRLIDQAQHAINICRPMVENIRQMRQTPDFNTEDFDNGFEKVSVVLDSM